MSKPGHYTPAEKIMVLKRKVELEAKLKRRAA